MKTIVKKGSISRALLLFLIAFASFTVFGDLKAQSSQSNLVSKLKEKPLGIDNYGFAAYYNAGYQINNFRGYKIMNGSSAIQSFKLNPNGSSYAVLSSTKKGSNVTIYDLWKPNAILYKFKMLLPPVAITYSPDSKTLAIADNVNTIHFYDTRTYIETGKITASIFPSKIAISANNFYMGVASGNKLQIWNLENKELRKEIVTSSQVNSFAFSKGDASLIVATSNGEVTVYDTKSFNQTHNFTSLGTATSCDVNNTGKYIAVVSGDNKITLLNKFQKNDKQYIIPEGNGIGNVQFVLNKKGETFLFYNTNNTLEFYYLADINPYYNQLLTDELNSKMDVWMKQMEGESLEDYQLRMSDENRMEQIKLFEQEISTRLADDLLANSEITLGSFNTQENTLAIDFNTMPSIYLDVPMDQIGSFQDVNNLEFRNAQYGITADDNFELVYVDVYNKATGETYTFDNRERRNLDFLQLEDSFVPLEVAQLSNMDEVKLKDLRDEVVDNAIKQNTITNHTNVDVKTSINPSVNANGDKIINYNVGVSYTVEKEYSAKEDFTPGKFKVENSGAATAMLSIIDKAFENEFKQYLVPGKKLIITITGMADKLPINGKILYDGCYGDFKNEPVWGEELFAINLTKAEGITTNEQLAFARAVSIKDSIEKNIEGISDMQTSFEYKIEVSDKVGGEYRRISVNFEFVDAF